jgi:hypothetical protein
MSLQLNMTRHLSRGLIWVCSGTMFGIRNNILATDPASLASYLCNVLSPMKTLSLMSCSNMHVTPLVLRRG